MEGETTSTSTETGDEKYKADSRDTHNKFENLSTSKLLAMLISPRKRTVSDLLKAFDYNLVDLFSATLPQLTKVKGIGPVKASQIQAAFELGKRISAYTKEEHPKITCKEAVTHLVAPHTMYLKQEEFRVLLLNSKKRLIRQCRVYLGSFDRAYVHPREVFQCAIAAGAPFVILVHNHPSGDPTPSEEDILITGELLRCGRILGIEVLDHIIIGCSHHVSLKDENLLLSTTDSVLLKR